VGAQPDKQSHVASGLDAADFDPIALHNNNIALLDEQDVIVASFPGAGASLVGNILLELGLEYFDPYTQRLIQQGTVVSEPRRVAYRRRLAASMARDGESPGRHSNGRRFVKTHLLPDMFDRSRAHRAVLLVRDPRDTLFSYYNWRLGFSEEGETRTFERYLTEPNLSGVRPVDDWQLFHELWNRSALHVIRFEDLKSDPFNAVETFLYAFDITYAGDDLRRALRRSSFDAMRRHEDAYADTPHRIMRHGVPGEWHDWYQGDIVAHFAEPSLRPLAGTYGYAL